MAGWSYGQPIITKRASDSRWVVYVTSGYDNSTGKGIVYELDAATGTVLSCPVIALPFKKFNW